MNPKMKQQELGHHLVEVKIISKETVKPSLPPPSHPTTFSLSLLDQIFPVVGLVPVLLFYDATTATPQCGRGVDLTALKLSLSQTLDRFYPLAGRLLDESTISCDDQGVPFIETIVNCHLSHILESPDKLKLLTKFLPTPAFVPLSIQINKFLCSGVVLCCFFSHKLMDGTSFGTFLNHWASLASKRFTDLVQPDFEATKVAFPPLPTLDQVFINPDILNMNPLPSVRGTLDHDHHHLNVVVKSFIFSDSAISNLTAKATSQHVPKPTRFEALAGFIWEQNFANARAQLDHTQLLFHVDMRKRMSPPLPRGAIGNLFVPHVQAKADKTSTLQHFAEAIHSALDNISHKITTVYQCENGGQVSVSERKAELLQAANEVECRDGQYRISSWCNMGLNEADFGFGKPVWVAPSDGSQPLPGFRNVMFLTDYRSPVVGNGIEAWLFLEESDMKALESSPHFLAFASPN